MNSAPIQAQSAGIKVDRIAVNAASDASGSWVSVTFPSVFDTVPVVIVSPTNANSDPATVRIRNVTQAGFEALVVEPSGSDASTDAMTIDYFAAEQGVYTFAGAVRFEVGTLSTATYQGNLIGGAGWESVVFNTSFDTPAVVTQVQTVNSQPNLDVGIPATPWLEVALQNVTDTGMQLALERAETTDGVLVAETVGYMVMSSGERFVLADETVQALRTANNIQGWGDGCFNNSFPSAFAGTPLAIASQMSRAGNNGGWARRCSLSANDIGLTIDEDINSDSERNHINETAGVLSASGPFIGSRNGRSIAAGQFTVAAGSIVSEWTRVDFDPAFNTTPFVFALNPNTELTPSAARLRNVSATGFDIALVKPNSEVNAAVESIVDYVAAVPGEYAMPNGDLFEIGSITTTAAQGVIGNGNWDRVNFSSIFTSPPSVLTQVQSINNEPALDPSDPSVPWLTVAARGLSSTGIDLALETAQTTVGSINVAETIAYFAVNNGANGTIESDQGNEVAYEMYLSPDNIRGWDEGCFNSNFADSYTDPLVIASQLRRDGSDGGWVRRCAISQSSVGLSIDEDRDADREREHTTEQAGVFVFGSPFQGDLLVTSHYLITHGGSGVTCEAEQISVSPRAINNSVVPAAGETIRISANALDAGWDVSNTTWSLASGSGQVVGIGPGYIDYQFAEGETVVQLWLSNSVAATVDIDVVDLNNANIRDRDGDVTDDPALIFGDTGFRFYTDAAGTLPIPAALIAGESVPLFLRAVETDPETQACVARVSGPQTVDLGYECINPAICFRDRDANVFGTPLGDNDLGNVVSFENIDLEFNADGTAALTLQFFDAGQIRLHARLNLPASGNEAAFTLDGSSAITTSKPADLFITTITASDGTANPGASTSGSGFVAGGSPFTVSLEARGSTGLSTPNFSLASGVDLIQLAVESLILPAGGDIGSLANATSFVDQGEGRYRNINVSWNNVGTMQLRASIADGDYLGSGNVIGSVSDPVGRFFPSEFSLQSSLVTNSCPTGNFTYMSDQIANYRDIGVQHDIAALLANGDVATNYEAPYPVSTMLYVAEDNNNGIDMSGRLSVEATDWIEGRYQLTNSQNASFRRALSGLNEIIDGPFNNLVIAVKTDLATSLDPTDFSDDQLDANASSSGDCSSTDSCDAASLSGSINVVFGRLYATNAHGPESARLPITLETQFWDGLRFVLSTGDDCSQVGLADTRFNNVSLLTDPSRIVPVGGGSTTGNFANFNAGSDFRMSAGEAGLVFSAPGAGNTGRFNVDIDLSNLPWLRFDWDQNGDHRNDAALPSIEVSFGSYRGHDRVIYWREVLSN